MKKLVATLICIMEFTLTFVILSRLSTEITTPIILSALAGVGSLLFFYNGSGTIKLISVPSKKHLILYILICFLLYVLGSIGEYLIFSVLFSERIANIFMISSAFYFFFPEFIGNIYAIVKKFQNLNTQLIVGKKSCF